MHVIDIFIRVNKDDDILESQSYMYMEGSNTGALMPI